MSAIESHSNGKHSLEDDVPVKSAKMLKTENGSKQQNGNNGVVKQDDDTTGDASTNKYELSESEVEDESNTNDLGSSNGSKLDENSESNGRVDLAGLRQHHPQRPVKNLAENSTDNYGDEDEDDEEDDEDDGVLDGEGHDEEDEDDDDEHDDEDDEDEDGVEDDEEGNEDNEEDEDDEGADE